MQNITRSAIPPSSAYLVRWMHSEIRSSPAQAMADASLRVFFSSDRGVYSHAHSPHTKVTTITSSSVNTIHMKRIHVHYVEDGPDLRIRHQSLPRYGVAEFPATTASLSQLISVDVMLFYANYILVWWHFTRPLNFLLVNPWTSKRSSKLLKRSSTTGSRPLPLFNP